MDAWQAAVLAVVALLIGALVPMLIQASLALRALRAAALQAGPALAALTTTTQRLDRLTARLEADGRLERALEAVDSLARTIIRFQDTARVATAVGAAVGPAVGAAVRSWRASREDGPPPIDGAGDTSHQPK